MAVLLLLLALLPFIKADCTTQKYQVSCGGSYLLPQIPTSTRSAIFVDPRVPPCPSLADLKHRSSNLTHVRVAKGAPLCSCLLSEAVPCNLTVVGCSSTPIKGNCTVVAPAYDSSRSIVALAFTTALFCITTLVVAVAFCLTYQKQKIEYRLLMRAYFQVRDELDVFRAAVQQNPPAPAAAVDLDTTLPYGVQSDEEEEDDLYG